MNERIKELACKALDRAVPETWTTLTPDQLEKVQEKFAELIVRECTEVSINNGCGDFVDIKQKLFEHFGVKE